MCHSLTPREATQAPVAKAALAKVSSTTVDTYPCVPSFRFDTSSAASSQRRGTAETALYLSELYGAVRTNASLRGAKKLHEVLLSSNPGRVTDYNDRHFSCLSRVSPANGETGSGNRLGATLSKSLSKRYPL